jgi:peptidoglycan/LPS O-acetylase OafA/YrhL
LGRDHIDLSNKFFWISIITLLCSAVNKDLFFITYNLVIAYILFFIAYIPSGSIRIFNRVGDYSYGTYIYAFPVQQALAALIPGVSVMQMIVISGIITLLLAILSWRFIEMHALGLKEHFVYHSQKIIDRYYLKYGSAGDSN